MSTIILTQLSLVHTPGRHMTNCMEKSTDVDRRLLYVNGWTPLMEPKICKIFIDYLHVRTAKFKSERYDETQVLILRIRWISELPSFLHLKIFAFQCAVYATNVSRAGFNVNYSNTIYYNILRMARYPPISPIAAPV